MVSLDLAAIDGVASSDRSAAPLQFVPYKIDKTLTQSVGSESSREANYDHY